MLTFPARIVSRNRLIFLKYYHTIKQIAQLMSTEEPGIIRYDNPIKNNAGPFLVFELMNFQVNYLKLRSSLLKKYQKVVRFNLENRSCLEYPSKPLV